GRRRPGAPCSLASFDPRGVDSARASSGGSARGDCRPYRCFPASHSWRAPAIHGWGTRRERCSGPAHGPLLAGKRRAGYSAAMEIRSASLALALALAACGAEVDSVPPPPPLPDADLTEPNVLRALEESRAKAAAAPGEAAARRLHAARLDANGFDGAAAQEWSVVVRLSPD